MLRGMQVIFTHRARLPPGSPNGAAFARFTWAGLYAALVAGEARRLADVAPAQSVGHGVAAQLCGFATGDGDARRCCNRSGRDAAPRIQPRLQTSAKLSAKGRGFMSFKAATSRLRLALIPMLANGRTVGPVQSLFDQIFDC